MNQPPEIHYVNDPVGRLYGLACSMRRLADLLDCDDDPFSTLVRLIGEDIENCAVILDEGPDTDAESGWELP